MTHVQVRVHIAAPIDRVFDAVSDHEAFLKASDGTSCKVTREGTTERNGLGCLREVHVGKRSRYLEEITAFERPRAFDYLMLETSMPMKHKGARLTFTEAGDGTDVEWSTRFDVTVPILGPLVGLIARPLFARAFTGLLRGAKTTLEASAGPPAS